MSLKQVSGETSTQALTNAVLTPGRLAEIMSAGLRTFVPGEIVAGRFRVEAFLAEGGMGEVYAARDLELNERVALKTIRPALAGNDIMLARFKQEIQLARKVTHSNVSRVFDLFRHEVDFAGQRRTITFLSMEFLHGETLAERLHRVGPMSLAETRRIAGQLAAGLEAAHSAGIIHSDFKPGNIALVRGGSTAGERAVIMDFGLAGTLISLGGTGRKEIVGTPTYMAPEQVENGVLSPATDIYAFGIVLYEMISGTLPFRGKSAFETAQLRLTQNAPLLRATVPRVPPAWEDTVRACLERDPAARPPSAPDVMSRLLRLERKRKLRFAAVCACAAGLAAAAVYVATQPHQPLRAALDAADSARAKLQNGTETGFSEAIADYRRAIRLDPKWAEPWADLAYAYATASNAAWIRPSVARSEASADALKAIAMDGRSAKAYAALGWVQSLDFDEWPRAEGDFRKAIRADAEDAVTHSWFGVHLRKKGSFLAAEAEDQLALSLSHRSDPSMWCELVFLYWTSGKLERMGQTLQQLLLSYPNYGFTRFLNARLLKEKGAFAEALRELDFCERLGFSAVTVTAERASIEARRGNASEARVLLGKLEAISRTAPVDGLLIAGVYVQLHELDRAFAWLDRAYAQRDSTLLSAATSPVLKPLRTDVRFAASMKRLHY